MWKWEKLSGTYLLIIFVEDFLHTNNLHWKAWCIKEQRGFKGGGVEVWEGNRRQQEQWKITIVVQTNISWINWAHHQWRAPVMVGKSFLLGKFFSFFKILVVLCFLFSSPFFFVGFGFVLSFLFFSFFLIFFKK
jgi:hypothetical protein